MSLEYYTHRFLATCPMGVEELLGDEIKALGVKKCRVSPTRVEFESSPEVVLELILTSRLASRVYKKYFSYSFSTWKEMSSKLSKVKWATLIDEGHSIKITSTLLSKPSFFPTWLRNTIYPSQLTKDAIFDYFRNENPERPIEEKLSVDLKSPEVSIHLHLFASEPSFDGPSDLLEADLLIDLCRDSLSHRGYRPMAQSQVLAPMRENLAAAILTFSGLKTKVANFLNEKAPRPLVVDLCCGSGTFLAESFLLAYDIPASYEKIQTALRQPHPRWGFQFLPWFKRDQKLQNGFKEQLEHFSSKVSFKKIEDIGGAPIKLVGIDLDPRAIEVTQQLLNSLGAQDLCELWCADCLEVGPKELGLKELLEGEGEVTQLQAQGAQTTLVANLPYGERLDSDKEFYHQFGEQLKHRWVHTTAYVVASDRELYKQISLKTKRKFLAQNGQIEIKCLEYPLLPFRKF